MRLAAGLAALGLLLSACWVPPVPQDRTESSGSVASEAMEAVPELPPVGAPPAGEEGGGEEAYELFRNALPDPDLENPFDGEAIGEEIRRVQERCTELYAAMEREEDLLGRVFRPRQGELEQVAAEIAALGLPVSGGVHSGFELENPGPLLAFYEDVAAGRDSEAGVYEIDSLGGLSRACFLHRAGELYYARAPFGWNLELEPYAPPVEVVFRLDYLFLTEKGYFIYGNEKSAFSNVTGGYRTVPLDRENRELAERYLAPLRGYGGHNVLSEDWDASRLQAVAFNDVFDMLYPWEYGQDPWEVFREPYGSGKPYIHGVPAEVFEAVITRYFPVEPEALREMAVYDRESRAYAWTSYMGGGQFLEWEVVDHSRNSDGSITLTVDAMCLHRGVDWVATNTLTVLPLPDGGFHYLSNEIRRNEEVADWLPPHRPRVTGQPRPQG